MTDSSIRASLARGLVGREREMSLIASLIARVLAGTGTTIAFSGEAGIGKSRMIGATLKLFNDAANGDTWLFPGQCFEGDQSCPRAPLVDMLRRWMSADGNQPYLSFLDEFRHLIPELGGLPNGDPQSGHEQAERRRLFSAFNDLITAVSNDHPTLMIFEDVHWADEITLELIPYLARENLNRPVLLLFSYRSEEIDPAIRRMLARLDRDRTHVEFGLGQLTRQQTDMFLRDILDQDHPIRSDFLSAIHELTDGNPFFIEEVLHSLIESGDVYLADGHWQRKEVEELHIPRSVHDSVWQRAFGLSNQAREMLSIAAVAGRSFDLSILQELTGLSDSELLTCVRELIQSQMIVEESADRFTFRHALTRQAIYSDLLGRARRGIHESLARAIERSQTLPSVQAPAELAYHYEQAEVWEKALGYATEAGYRAASQFAPKSAAMQFSRALRAAERLGLDPDPRIFGRRAQSYVTLGNFDLADSDYSMMLQRAREMGDGALEWEALIGLGDLWAGRDYDRAGSFFQTALDLAREMDDNRAIARSQVHLANWQVNTERLTQAEKTLRDAIEVFEDLDDQPGIAEATDFLSVVSDLSGDLRRMRKRLQEVLARYRELGDRRGEASVLANIAATGGAYVLFEVISLAGGVSATEAESKGWQAIQLARDIDWSSGESYALLTLALHHRAHGEFGQALELARAGLRIALEIEHHEWEIVARLTLGCIYSDLHDLRTEATYVERARELSDQSGSMLWKRLTSGFLASNRVAEGRLDEAREILRRPGSSLPMDTIGQRVIWIARARLAVATGDSVRALEIIDALFETARNTSSEQDIPALARVRGEILLSLGKQDEAKRSLLAARDGALALGLRSNVWRVELNLGRLYLSMGRQDSAQERFEEARRIIEQLAETVSPDELRTCFRERALSLIPERREPLDDLTPRERQVAELIASGLSNREIADALYIGERTVETHVGNVLAKRGFSSRTQIASWFNRQTQTTNLW